MADAASGGVDGGTAPPACMAGATCVAGEIAGGGSACAATGARVEAGTIVGSWQIALQ